MDRSLCMESLPPVRPHPFPSFFGFSFQDNDSFQTKFNALIELNQANRGDLLRHPTLDKLANFLGELNSHKTAAPTGQPLPTTVTDPTSLWYFLTIHDTILFPLGNYLQWKTRMERRTTHWEVRDEGSSSIKRPRLF